MPADPDVLTRPLTVGEVERLHESGLLSRDARDAALDLVRPAPSWLPWLRLRLLVLGFAFLLCGIVFFFAYNWDALNRLSKIALVQAGLIAAIAGAVVARRDGLLGQMLLLAATVMVGVNLAVIGQVYQTGADAWELFAAWAALSAAGAVLSGFAPHWIAWLVVVHAAAILWFSQTGGRNGTTLCLSLAALDFAAFGAREFAERKGIAWASKSWVQLLLWGATLMFLTMSPVALIFNVDRGEWAGAPAVVGTAIWLGVVAWATRFFRYRRPSLAGLTLTAVAAALVFLSLVGKVLFNESDAAFQFFAFSATTIGVIGGLVVALRGAHLAMGETDRD